ncbi:regucalcin isoform X2 [Phlebotomus argentipes]|uniref:regucalcin isoform X2 n=1 Tax=Phlebotomus argentipes TaxID=94469 RepID=UPI0028934224|nr:regucalcin isoform X2 [Phlebotomus argentipes]
MLKIFALSVVLASISARMTAYKVEQVPAPLANLGEGPHWDWQTQNLYYVDIYGGTINRFSYAENKTYSATVDKEPVISFIIPVEGNDAEFAIGIGRRVGIVTWDGKSATSKVTRLVGQVEQDDHKYKTNRFNDGKADPKGRLFAGTMQLEECEGFLDARLGALYKFTKDGEFDKLKSNIGISNGLAWNEKTNKFYYIDSCALDVKEHSYNPVSGEITNPRVLIDFSVNGERPNYVPDGMTIDSEGNLYVALWGGNKVLKVCPNSGKVIQEIDIPAEQVTSAAFGGPNLDILYVTTAATERDRPQPPPAGGVFAVKGLGVTGTKMTRANV